MRLTGSGFRLEHLFMLYAIVAMACAIAGQVLQAAWLEYLGYALLIPVALLIIAGTIYLVADKRRDRAAARKR